ncbi:phosphatidylinositol N-acetylglucosaminyltransferase subunit P-like [Mya arenaria]|uniref:phosphatidylinositol N-acetylglucosaminyltransferase subunit P-like n=1 Tax=Mya arenaria TaxID=6604 RepID=UPI0022E59D60|nr:phosphatidylinositol N-acetylglucosaminyltransferase subunit P-like [Mya arenaria]
MSSPSPTPVRAIYGFVLYLSAYVAFVAYVIWAYFPESWLEAIGFSYLPQKYWAVAVPCYLCVLWLLAYPAWFGYIHLCTPPVDSLLYVTDEFANPANEDPVPANSTPQISDLSVSQVNRQLYL